MTLDFNDIAPLPDHNRRPLSDAEREELRADLLARLESVLFTLFSAGKKRRGKFVIGDVLGSPGDSLEVVLDGDKQGLWTDRATGDGGDIYALIAAHLGIDVLHDFPRVLDAAADLLGRSRSAPVRKASKKDVPVDELGPATAKWDYLDAAGHLIAVVYRYDPPGQKKQFRPWDAKRRRMAPPDPRPLYNQPGMSSAAQVVLVEGEKCAQALIDAGNVLRAGIVIGSVDYASLPGVVFTGEVRYASRTQRPTVGQTAHEWQQAVQREDGAVQGQQDATATPAGWGAVWQRGGVSVHGIAHRLPPILVAAPLLRRTGQQQATRLHGATGFAHENATPIAQIRTGVFQNATRLRDAKRLLLGFVAFRSVLGDLCFRGLRHRRAQFDACLEGRFQRIPDAPDRRVVEVQAVGVAGFQGVEAQMFLGNQGEDGVDLAHGVFLSGCGWRDVMNALFPMEAKLNPQE